MLSCDNKYNPQNSRQRKQLTEKLSAIVTAVPCRFVFLVQTKLQFKEYYQLQVP